MNSADHKPHTPTGSSKKIRGRRHVLFDIDLANEIAWPLAMGKSADWLRLLGCDLPCPVVEEIDADEANEIARRAILPIDDTTITAIARGARCSRRLIVNTIRQMTREARARIQSGTLVPPLLGLGTEPWTRKPSCDSGRSAWSRAIRPSRESQSSAFDGQ